MNCVLTIKGKNFDVDSFLAKSRLKPYKKKYKGQPLMETKPNGKKLSFSLISFLPSKAGFEDLPKQIRETIGFLKRNKKKLSYIAKVKTIDSALLDFGIHLRIDKKTVLAQTDIFPSELLKIAGELNIDVGLSIYPPDLEIILKNLRDS